MDYEEVMIYFTSLCGLNQYLFSGKGMIISFSIFTATASPDTMNSAPIGQQLC
jgi:hypothetical protein